MHRVTVTLDADLLEEIDRLIEEKGYQNRSEAVRDLARAGIRQAAEDSGTSKNCVAALVYVYDHVPRELSKRLVQSFHENHDLVLATTHVHLDHDSCLEVTMMKGPTPEVQQVADRVIAERGVRYGRVVMIPAEMEPQKHAHLHDAGHPHSHIHIKPAK